MIDSAFRRRWLAWLFAGAACALAAPPSPAGNSPVGREDVQARKQLLGKLGKEIPSDSAILDVLQSERKFRKLAVAWPQEKEVQRRYQDLLNTLPPGAWVGLEEARAILEMDLLLSRRENQDQAQHIQREAARKRPEPVTGPEAEKLAQFQAGELQLALPPERCIASDAEGRDCFLTVSDFNRSALTFVAPRAMGLDSARRQLLDKSLNVLYYVREARRTGAADDPAMRQRLAQRAKAMAARKGERRAIDSTELLRLYRKYHDSLFAAREEAELEILGGTDSSEVDSLYRLALAQATRRTRAKPAGPDSSLKLPWRRFPADKLPPALVAATDTLPLGGVSPKIGLGYGTFVLRVASLRTVPERTFEEARSRLYDMARQGVGPVEDHELESQAKAFYQAHPGRFLSPDTVWLMLRLSSLRPGGAALAVRSTDLPPLLRDALEPLWRQADANGPGVAKTRAAAGPKPKAGRSDSVATPLGPARVEILRRRTGGRPLAYAAARPAILAILRGRPRTLAEIPEADRERFAVDEALALAYWTRGVQSTPRPDDKETLASLTSGQVPKAALRTALSQTDTLESARRWLIDQRWRRPQEEWKASLRVDWAILNRDGMGF